MYKVLMVEDNRLIREGIAKFFGKRDQIDLSFAVDGNDGLDKILNGDYDLYLLDIRLPNTNGIDLGKKIREHNENVIIAFALRCIEFSRYFFNNNLSCWFKK